MLSWDVIFQLILLALFLVLTVGKTFYLRWAKQVNAIVLGRSARGSVEILILATLIWVVVLLNLSAGFGRKVSPMAGNYPRGAYPGPVRLCLFWKP